jgi:hypothetical protein
MKTFLVATGMFFASILSSQNGAKIEYKLFSTSGAKGAMKLNYSEYGSVSEFNMTMPQMPGSGMTTKSLSQTSKPGFIYMINDQNKTYSEIKQADMVKEDTKTYTVKKLGDETVNGYKCSHALITEGKETHEVWNTKDIADFDKIVASFKTNNRFGSQKREKALKDAGCEGMLVKMISKGNAREGDMTMELVKMKKKAFTKSDFEIPSGYAKGGMADGMTMPGMKSQAEIMKMTPEEREKYVEELKKQYAPK